MDTPVAGFLGEYQQSDLSRFHMPGHKGQGPLGCESWDITEVLGADALYEADGIIARAEANTAAVFGAGRTLWSTEGSSQCVKAMLYLAVTCRREGTAPVVLAARNVHKSFVFAAGLVGFDVEWLWPEKTGSLCACPVTAKQLEAALAGMETPPCAVYLTSPDYLGNVQDIRALARVAHKYGCLLLVDNAHGAYLHFLDKPCHPLDQGADLCCDSAHKTMPVLTGGAWLHIAKRVGRVLTNRAKDAMALFGSTSPSYLTMASLDVCNAWMEGPGGEQIRLAAQRVERLKETLTGKGWALVGQEALKLTLDAKAVGMTGEALGQKLREGGVEPEYVDPDFVVLMASAYTDEEAFRRVEAALGEAPASQRPETAPAAETDFRPQRAMSIRQALLAPSEEVSVKKALGRVCAAPTVSCPPAIPIVASGEVFDKEAVEMLERYGVGRCLVVREVKG